MEWLYESDTATAICSIAALRVAEAEGAAVNDSDDNLAMFAIADDRVAAFPMRKDDLAAVLASSGEAANILSAGFRQRCDSRQVDAPICIQLRVDAGESSTQWIWVVLQAWYRQTSEACWFCHPHAPDRHIYRRFC